MRVAIFRQLPCLKLHVLMTLVFLLLSFHSAGSVIDPEASCNEGFNTENIPIPDCLLTRERPESPEALIMGDINVCKCMKQSAPFIASMTPVTTEILADTIKIRELENLDRIAATGAVLQAGQYAKTKLDMDRTVLVYAGAEARVASSNIRSTNSQGPQLSSEISVVNSIPADNSDWQCVTYQEYSVQREIPYSNDFFLLLKETSDFSSADWNYSELIRKYDTASPEDREKISTKLIFLNRNPIFKTIFKARPSKQFTAEIINRKQLELFSILQSLRPAANSTCANAPNGCWREMHESTTYDNYNRRVGEFLRDTSVTDLSSAHAAVEYREALDNLQEVPTDTSRIPTDPNAYYSYVVRTNPKIIQSCYGTNPDPLCYPEFKDHCEHIMRIDSRVREGIRRAGSDVLAALSEDASVHYLLDPENNPNFRAFNDKICQQPFKNASGESHDFFSYRNKFCHGDNAPLAECSEREDLLARYLSEYNVGSEVADQNIRAGFSRIVGEAQFIEISELQVRVANTIRETPAELRARFGGRLPAISDSGNLVPAPGTPSQVATSSVEVPAPPPGADTTPTPAPVPRSVPSSNAQTRGDAVIPPAPVAFNRKSVEGFPGSQHTPFIPDLGLGRNSLLKSAVEQTNQLSVPESSLPPEPFVTSVPLTPLEKRNQVSNSIPSVPSIADGISPGVSSTGYRSIQGNSDATGVARVSRTERRSTPELFFKYDLDSSGNEIQPEVSIVPPTPVKVSVEYPAARIASVRANPNSLMLGSDDLEEIMANPETEVQLVLKTESGEELLVYAKKDGTGGISFSLKSSTVTPVLRMPASLESIVRIKVNEDMYRRLSKNPEALNQSADLLSELAENFTSGMILQVVSPPRPAKVFRITRLDQDFYQFESAD